MLVRSVGINKRNRCSNFDTQQTWKENDTFRDGQTIEEIIDMPIFQEALEYKMLLL